MAKRPQQNRLPTQKPTAAAVNSAIGSPQQSGVVQIPVHQTTTQVYQGPIPHPDILRSFDELVPGTAARLIQLAEDEAKHRRNLEEAANTANISAQKKQLEIAEYQAKAVFRSDTIGQSSGVLVSLCCIGGAIYLAINGQQAAAAVLAAIPTAAIIQAFFVKKAVAPHQK